MRLNILFFWCGLVLAPIHTMAAQKSALVIGNTNYLESPLKNPVNDAKLVSDALIRAGFKTVVINNQTRDQLYKTVKQFTESLKKDSIALVYYAGHGVQINKSNYLLPVDIKLSNDVGVQSQAYPVDHLIERMNKSQAAINILVLDACRNNPFQNNSQFRGVDALGLSKVVNPRGMLVAYSTQPGTLAQDGNAENSIYAKAFANVIKRPGMTIEDAFNLVGQVVRVQTDDMQQPMIESSIADKFYFLPPPDVAMMPKSYNRNTVKVINDNGDSRGVETKSVIFEQKSQLVKDPRKEITSFGLRWHQEDFFDALVRGDEKIVRLYIQGGMRFQNGGQYDYNLVNLIDQNKQSHKVIKLLLDEKAIDLNDLNKKYNSLSLQSLGGMMEVFGSDEGFIKPISAAVWTRQPELIKVLVAHGANLKKYCSSTRTLAESQNCKRLIDPSKS